MFTGIVTDVGRVKAVERRGDTLFTIGTNFDAADGRLELLGAVETAQHEAAGLANFAGGVVCGEVGIVPIMPDALLSRVLSYQS